MRTPNKNKTEDRRQTERRDTPETERRSEPQRAVAGERRVQEQRGLGTAMVDALGDILKWERASERALRVAADGSTADLSKN